MAAKKIDSLDAIKKRCIECHDQSYGEILVRWKATSEGLLKKVAPRIEKVRQEIGRIELRGGHTFVYRKLFGEAELNYNLARKGNVRICQSSSGRGHQTVVKKEVVLHFSKEQLPIRP
jgi:hypothetical protein